MSNPRDEWMRGLGVDVPDLRTRAGAPAPSASLDIVGMPSPMMDEDCKPVRGKVPGPAEHLLCAVHGHIVDIKTKEIVAKNLAEYIKLHPRGGAAPASKQRPQLGGLLPDCKPVRGKVSGPAEHVLCVKHGHILDLKQKKIIAGSLDEYQRMAAKGAGHVIAAGGNVGSTRKPAGPSTRPGGVSAGPNDPMFDGGLRGDPSALAGAAKAIGDAASDLAQRAGGFIAEAAGGIDLDGVDLRQDVRTPAGAAPGPAATPPLPPGEGEDLSLAGFQRFQDRIGEDLKQGVRARTRSAAEGLGVSPATVDGLFEAADQVAQFQKGLREGEDEENRNFLKMTTPGQLVSGVKTGVRILSADDPLNELGVVAEEKFTTAVNVGAFVGAAMSDPVGTGMKLGTVAGEEFKKEQAKGEGARFIGKGVGRAATAVGIMVATGGLAGAAEGGVVAGEAGALGAEGGVLAREGGVIAEEGGIIAEEGGIIAEEGGLLGPKTVIPEGEPIIPLQERPTEFPRGPGFDPTVRPPGTPVEGDFPPGVETPFEDPLNPRFPRPPQLPTFEPGFEPPPPDTIPEPAPSFRPEPAEIVPDTEPTGPPERVFFPDEALPPDSRRLTIPEGE